MDVLLLVERLEALRAVVGMGNLRQAIGLDKRHCAFLRRGIESQERQNRPLSRFATG